jgi:CRISPR-associated protein Cas6/Cse3/CasE subtype I-E
MTVYLVRMELSEKNLYNYYRRTGRREADEGYLIKGALSGLLTDAHRPTPYSIEPSRGGTVPILGYVKETAEALQLAIDQFADPEAASILVPGTLFTKSLPTQWPSRVGFSIRVSPHKRGAQHRDYYSAEVSRRPEITREEAYIEWLTRRFEGSGAELQEVYLLEAQPIRVCRPHTAKGDAPRQEIMMSLTDAKMAGILHITDQDAFARFLPLGVGRQRAFGFGMLKLHALG